MPVVDPVGLALDVGGFVVASCGRPHSSKLWPFEMVSLEVEKNIN